MSTASDAPALTAESTRRYRNHVAEAAAAIRERGGVLPSVGLVVDAGLEGLGDAFDAESVWATEDLPHVPGPDEGRRTLAVGAFGDVPVVVLDGTLPLHDGFTPRQAAFPVRVLAEAGVETLLFATRTESVHPEVRPSDLFLVTDHVNFQGVNPLVGPNVDDWGPRFPDMSEPYDPELRRTAEQVALREGLRLSKGILFAVLGPDLGTRAECRMARTLGGDVVGATTVPEVITARHMDLRVMTVSVVADRCLPDAVEPAPPGDGTQAVATARPHLRRLLRGVVEAVDGEDGSA